MSTKEVFSFVDKLTNGRLQNGPAIGLFAGGFDAYENKKASSQNPWLIKL